MPPRQAQIRLNTKPTKMKVRERKSVSINVRNTGSEDWKRGEYELVPIDGARRRVRRWVRRPVPIRAVRAGSTDIMRFVITAPGLPKRYAYQWQVKRRRARFIGRFSQKHRIKVVQKED